MPKTRAWRTLVIFIRFLSVKSGKPNATCFASGSPLMYIYTYIHIVHLRPWSAQSLVFYRGKCRGLTWAQPKNKSIFNICLSSPEPNPREFTGGCVLEAIWSFIFCWVFLGPMNLILVNSRGFALWSFIFCWVFLGPRSLILVNSGGFAFWSFIFWGSEEPNPREFTMVCALELYFLRVWGA